MPRRIDIELTSALADGSWTWRAAGARQPKGVVDGTVLPTGVKVGDELKVEVEQELDGLTVLGVVHGREREDPETLELLPVERDFQPVVEHRATGGRSDRPRRPRSDRDDSRGERRERRGRDERTGDRSDRGDRRGRSRDGDGRERRGPSFTPPPELPQRPKPKRLRPGKAHRAAVLAELPEEQRPIAELTLQGMGAVRQRLREENERAAKDGKPQMPEATVLKMAEELLPKLRVAEWLDRAEAAQRQIEHLDLRDIRSVVAAGDDPIVARDESTRALAAELKEALAVKQASELQLWFGDVDAALAVGRVIRALRLSSQPPKAGVPFPPDIAQRLADSTNAALTPMDGPDRWAATLEAAAFSPVRTMVQPARKPDTVSDELLATVKRLAPALPQVAALFEIEVAANVPMPKPLRPAPRPKPGAKPDEARPARTRKPKPAKATANTPPAKSSAEPEVATEPDLPEAATDAEPDATAQPDLAEAATETEPVSGTTPDTTEADAPAEPDASTEPDLTETEPDTQAEPAATAEPETPEPDTQAEPDASAEPEPAATAEADTQAEPDAPAEPVSDATPDG